MKDKYIPEIVDYVRGRKMPKRRALVIAKAYAMRYYLTELEFQWGDEVFYMEYKLTGKLVRMEIVLS